MTRFRWLRRWWMRQHHFTRCWPWCRDCRWAQQAAAAGEFYTHDDPRWYIRETLTRPPDFVTDESAEFDTTEPEFDRMLAESDPAELIPPPVGQNLTLGPPDWKPRPATETRAVGRTKVRLP